MPFFYRGIAQSGSAPALGAGCQEFESPYPDHTENPRIERYGDFFCPEFGAGCVLPVLPRFDSSSAPQNPLSSSVTEWSGIRCKTRRPNVFHCVGKGSLCIQDHMRTHVHQRHQPQHRKRCLMVACSVSRAEVISTLGRPQCATAHRPPQRPAGHAWHHRHSALRPNGCPVLRNNHSTGPVPSRLRASVARCEPANGQKPGLGRGYSNVWPPHELARHEITPRRAPAKALDRWADAVGEVERLSADAIHSMGICRRR